MTIRCLKKLVICSVSIIGINLLSGCTGQLPGSFRLAQQEEVFATSQEINTKLDMLWVIDNSGSMDVSQQRIRDGFSGFAQKYMKPNWDIRVAVITTDTYLAHPAFTNYLNLYQVPVGSPAQSSYLRGITANGIPGRSTPFVNPPWAPNLVNMNPASPDYGKFTAGLKVNQGRPQLGPNWAKLLPGNHDGPMIALCHEANALFISATDVSKCYIRDDQTGNTGPERCAYPGSGETSASQCVNTPMNDTVHSGRSIIATIPPAGTPTDAAWTARLIQDFLVNLSVGVTGIGYERGLASLQQLLADNEVAGSPTAFFRKDSLRVIVLVGDEEDQTMIIPPAPYTGFLANSYYTTDAATCTKLIDGVSFTVPSCPDPTKLVPVADIKGQIDTFFHTLDQTGATENPNYFVVSIVASTAASVQNLRTQRSSNELDRADRFIELGNLVANGSSVMEIDNPDYSPMLDAIGMAILNKKAIFQLQRAPTTTEEMTVAIKHADGTLTVLLPSQFTVSGKVLTITDLDFLLSLANTDQIIINYQPKTLF
ncbi:MAG: hypothetical protein A2603_00975 [Bdellovibrionales bacterium RIFOXYD1_FULL_55_31]|nr:MAG: hypothetical protein A2603_00975 [Bdellovibrionales bacterium RIFOXYD1_FULL_55_31]